MLPPLLASVVAWLRAGYPNGVPERDYVPLFALLRRRLTDDEIAQVAQELRDDGIEPVETADIGVIITTITDEVPSADDVARVQQHLAAVGWPLAPDGTTD